MLEKETARHVESKEIIGIKINERKEITIERDNKDSSQKRLNKTEKL